MAVAKRYPAIMELDIALAGKNPGDTVVEVPNPEGREVLVTRAFLQRSAAPDQLGNAGLQLLIGETVIWGAFLQLLVGNEAMDGENPQDPVGVGIYNTTFAKLWPAGDSLIAALDPDGATAPNFVGKLYVEYWAAQRTGRLTSIS